MLYVIKFKTIERLKIKWGCNGVLFIDFLDFGRHFTTFTTFRYTSPVSPLLTTRNVGRVIKR